MKADISADNFRPEQHFASVVFGQGQVLVDSVLNEQQQIVRHRMDTSISDVIGSSGVPKLDGGFAVSVAPDGSDLLISPGRLYVDGIQCVNEPAIVGAVAVSATVLTLDPAPAGGGFRAEQWIDVVVGGASTLVQAASISGQDLTVSAAIPALVAGTRVSVRPVTSLRHQPDRLPFDPFAAGGPAPIAGGAYRIELDVWDRHISLVEDPSIREVALGDAEAATRLKVVWQIRLTPAGIVGGGTCATGIPGLKGQLIASTIPGPPVEGPCVLPDEAGYRGLENQLYRIEVHSASAGEVVLKWQRDNAGTVSAVTSLGAKLQLDDMGRDQERGFETAPLVEVTDDFLELEQQPGDLLQVSGPPDGNNRILTLSAAPVAAQITRRARARRWDGKIVIDPTSPTAGLPVPLERGLQVAVVSGPLIPGDYWTVPARTSNSAGGGTITWPVDDNGDALPQPPRGIVHHTAPLALVDASAAGFLTGPTNLRGCRTLFPPLNAIAAVDVAVDPTPCGFVGVTNMQQAIDALCNRGGGGLCTATATPGPGWEKVFDAIAAGADAQICFPVGSYPTPSLITVSGKGHLVLHGAGLGSALTSTSTKGVLAFSACASVSVQALTIRSGPNSGGGALTFDTCNDVTVRDCEFIGAAGEQQQSSCLYVEGGTLSLEGTRFEVGHRQAGVQAIDTSRAVLRQNRFRVAPLPAVVGPITIKSATKLERDQARRLLISDLRKGPPPTVRRIGVTIGQQAMSFATTPAAQTAWTNVLNPAYAEMKQFQKEIDRVLRAAFAGKPKAGAEAITAFVMDRIINRRIAVIGQAIVIAGRTAGEVHVESNDINSAVQGIHVGVSHRLQPRSGPADMVARVTIVDNRIRVVVPPEGARARHAIFVGNADRLRITGNDMTFDNRAEGDPITTSDGLRVHGFVGRALTVRDNTVDGFPGGITLNLYQESSLIRMLSVEDNLSIGANPPMSISGPLKSQVKLRGNRPGPPDN